MMVQSILRVGLACLVLTTVGCAQLSPQSIDFKPSLSTEDLVTGSGTASLIVEDKRSDKVIGLRGGAYSQTSTIESSRPLDQVIEEIALQVMDRAGIELSTAFPDMEISINLDKLSYISEDRQASIKRTTATAAVSIRVKKGNTVFENGYSTSQYVDTVGYASEDKNEELLNGVFEKVLQRMFSDQQLSAFLD